MSHNISVNGFYVWSKAMESSNQTANGLMTAQDFGVSGNPFTSTNGSLGALGGGLREERGPMDQKHDAMRPSPACGRSTTSTDRTKSCKEVVNGWQISPIVYLNERRAISMSTRIRQE